MADIADNSDEKIEAVVALGRAKIERELRSSKLHPIIVLVRGPSKEDDIKSGICHWCESEITPGHLFCEKDPHDSGMCCSESWDHDHKRRKEMGL